jgi:hypothetical protein
MDWERGLVSCYGVWIGGGAQDEETDIGFIV